VREGKAKIIADIIKYIFILQLNHLILNSKMQ